MDIMKQMHEVVPFRIGSRVRVGGSYKLWRDWPGVYVVTGLNWDYQRGQKINVTIASDLEIQAGHVATDGWSVDDLEPA